MRPRRALAALAALLLSLVVGLAGMPAGAATAARRSSTPTTPAAPAVPSTAAALPTPEPDNPLHFKGRTVQHFTSAPRHRRDSSDGEVEVTTTDLEYDVVLKPSCVRLNIDPNVATILCSPTTLAITVRDPALVPTSWAAGAIFNGGPQWNCTASPQDIQLGFPPDAIVAFTRRAVSVTVRDHVVEIHTVPAALGECFERATITHELTHTRANVSSTPQRRAPAAHQRPARWADDDDAPATRPPVAGSGDAAAVAPASEANGELTKRACPGINNVRFNNDFPGQLHANEWLVVWWDLCSINNGRLIRVVFYRNVRVLGDAKLATFTATITATEWRDGRSFKLDSSHRRDDAEFYAEITVYYLSNDCGWFESTPCERVIATAETPRFAFPVTDFTQPVADAQFHWTDYIKVAWTKAHSDATLRLRRNKPMASDTIVGSWNVADKTSVLVALPSNPCSGSGSIDLDDFLPFYFELKFACFGWCTTVVSRPFYVPCTNSHYLTLGSRLVDIDECDGQATVLGENMCTRRAQVLLTCDNCYVHLRDTTISNFQLNINNPLSGNVLESVRVGLQGTVDLNIDLHLHALVDRSWATKVGKVTTTIAGSPSLEIGGFSASVGLYLTTLFDIELGLRARADASAAYSGSIPFKVWYEYSNGNADFYKQVDLSSLQSTGSGLDGSVEAEGYLTVAFDVEASASFTSLARAFGTLSPSVTPKIRGALPPYAPTSSPMGMPTAWASVKMDVCAAQHYIEYGIVLDVDLLYGITVVNPFSSAGEELVSKGGYVPLYSGNVLRGCVFAASSSSATDSALPRVTVSLPFAQTFSAALQTTAQTASAIFDALANDVVSALSSVSSLSSYGLVVEAVSPTRIRIGLVGESHATTQAATDFAYQVQQTLSSQLASSSSTLRLGAVTRYLDSGKSIGVAVAATTLSSSAYITTDDEISLAALPAPTQPQSTPAPTSVPNPTSPGGGSGGTSPGGGSGGGGASTSDNSSSGAHGLGLPVIIGIAVGGAVLLAAAVAISMVVIRRRRAAHAAHHHGAKQEGPMVMTQPLPPPATTIDAAAPHHGALVID